MNDPRTHWPPLPPLEAWTDTFTTVHMWTQIVGKIRLALSPWLNHSWGSTLYLPAHGLTTSPMPFDDGSFDIEFDFVHHALHVRVRRTCGHATRDARNRIRYRSCRHRRASAMS